MTKSTTAMLAVTLAALSAFALSPARAGEARVVVSFGELDISSPAGEATLMHRLDRAARAVCGPEPTGVSRLYNQKPFDDCVQATNAKTMASLPQTVVARLYSNRYKTAMANGH